METMVLYFAWNKDWYAGGYRLLSMKGFVDFLFRFSNSIFGLNFGLEFSDLIIQPFWCWNRNIPGELDQYHDRWCPGSLCHQGISCHCIGYARQVGPYLTRRTIPTTCAIQWTHATMITSSLRRNDVATSRRNVSTLCWCYHCAVCPFWKFVCRVTRWLKSLWAAKKRGGGGLKSISGRKKGVQNWLFFHNYPKKGDLKSIPRSLPITSSSDPPPRDSSAMNTILISQLPPNLNRQKNHQYQYGKNMQSFT